MVGHFYYSYQHDGNTRYEVDETEQPTVIQTEPVSTKTPSELVGLICLVAIMLVGTLTAVDILGIPALEDVFRVVLAIAAQVLVGLVVFAIGLYLANLAFNLILSTGTSQSRLLAQSARIAIITLVGAMALNRMGIAPNIVNLSFRVDFRWYCCSDRPSLWFGW